MARSEEKRLLAQNKKARHRFVILETLECGISLVGTEVKSLRAGGASLVEAFGRIDRGELWLYGATIGEYSHGNRQNHKTTRPRKLLVHRRELDKWDKKVKEKGVTLVPLQIYFVGHLVKLEMALARGKKIYDKRETEKTKNAKRDMAREIGRRR